MGKKGVFSYYGFDGMLVVYASYAFAYFSGETTPFGQIIVSVQGMALLLSASLALAVVIAVLPWKGEKVIKVGKASLNMFFSSVAEYTNIFMLMVSVFLLGAFLGTDLATQSGQLFLVPIAYLFLALFNRMIARLLIKKEKLSLFLLVLFFSFFFAAIIFPEQSFLLMMASMLPLSPIAYKAFYYNIPKELKKKRNNWA